MKKHSRKKPEKQQQQVVPGMLGVEPNELMRQVETTPSEGEEVSLARAKVHWFFGEWQELVALDINALSHHPDRDRFALLAASAHQQLGNHEKARAYTRMALDWECDLRVVAQVLIAGVHNTLGRAASLRGDESRQTHHFKAAVAAIGTKDEKLVSHTRTIREMARMGMLPQAANLVDQQINSLGDLKQHPRQQEAQIKALQTEMELLSHELSLAQQRRQLYHNNANVLHGAPTIAPDNPAWLEELKNRSVAQLGQDIWVLEQTGFKQGGFFVEFGATDGVLLSNTFLLEKEFNWCGLCAEPNPKLFAQLKQNRSCLLSDQCIGGETGNQVEFIFADAYGGSQDYADQDQHEDKRAAYRAAGHVANLTTISLHDFLRQHDAPKDIDYLSIDTEGSEYEILQAFPFEQWNIRLLTVEHNFTERRKDIRKLLEGYGYQCREAQWDDWFEKRVS